MNIVMHVWDNWSTFEKLQEGSLLLGILLITLLAIYFITKNRSILLLSFIGFSISALLNVIGLYIVSTLFKIEVTEVFRLVPILTSILLVSNLGILVGFYIHRKGKKGFDIKDIRLEYFTDSVKQTIFLLLLSSSVFLFVSVQTQAILVVSTLSCLGAVWCVFWLSKKLLND